MSLDHHTLRRKSSLKELRHKNCVDKQAGDKEKECIEGQRKIAQKHLALAEGELKEHLRQLQTEKQILFELEGLEDERIIKDVTDVNIIHSSLSSVSGENIVNPYPITFTERPQSARIRRGLGHNQICQEKTGRRRRLSIEFEDLELQSSTGSLTRKASVPHENSRLLRTSSVHSVASNARASSASVSNTRLRRSDSTKSNSSTCTSISASPDEKEWLGDPKAIQSIRRPRKSIAKQRLDYLVARSNSVDLSGPVYKTVDGVTQAFKKLGSESPTSGPCSPNLLSPPPSVWDVPFTDQDTTKGINKLKNKKRGGSLKKLPGDTKYSLAANVNETPGTKSYRQPTPKQPMASKTALSRHNSFHV